MVKLLSEIDKLYEFIRFKRYVRSLTKRYNKNNYCDTAQTCHDLLIKTSRSFVIVILSLNQDLSHAVCIYYLVLRALDTVEDDFTINKDIKITMLEDFYKYLYNTDWSFHESSDKDKIVLEKFPNIATEFTNFPKIIRDVIEDICHKMGVGMSEFQQKNIITLDDWDKYCFYVAGLVGIGLTKLFVHVGNENASLIQKETLSISLGLFLQKINIIRDIKEDVLNKRYFWPLELIQIYLGSDATYFDLIASSKLSCSMYCSNELLYHTLKHVPECLCYISQIRDPAIFRFCAIPQVMALATLVLCFDNITLLEKNIKIPKYETVKIFNNCQNFQKTIILYHYYALKLKQKMKSTFTDLQDFKDSPCSKRIIEYRNRTFELIEDILVLTATNYYSLTSKSSVPITDNNCECENTLIPNGIKDDTEHLGLDMPNPTVEAPIFWMKNAQTHSSIAWIFNLSLLVFLFAYIIKFFINFFSQ